ncbi:MULTISPECIES: SDR family NAD(P)-dependent oxidoreductase [Streptomyces]|uniref:SDR family NAD(P)-dependent oxidoreductase n=1 Tax=Streptomyces lycopersici TaxID=2974589 RepID=UPI0021CF4884|nr:SDR family NAD(P)-dependent oxidoreductase [Streptomyces sp. NEAU-383]
MTPAHRPSSVEADIQRVEGRRLRSVVTAEDEIVRGHLVHEVPVLPGVFHLDLTLRLLKHAGIDPATAELRRCLFIAPVVATAEMDKELRIVVGERSGPDTVPVHVESRSLIGGEAVDDVWERNFQAEIKLGLHREKTVIDLADLTGPGATEEGPAEELYAFARQLAIHHRDFMKVSGRIQSRPRGALAQVALGDAASDYLDHFHIHPVVLDFSTLVPFLHFGRDQRAALTRPFIPIFIRSFRAAGTLSRESWVHVPPLSQRMVDGDTVTGDIAICGADGGVLASITGFTCKRVRSAEHITKFAEAVPAKAVPEPETTAEKHEASTAAPAESEAAASTVSSASLDRVITELVTEVLGGDGVEQDRGFYDLGLTSVNLLAIAGRLEKRLGQELYPTLLFEYPTVRSLAAYLREEGMEPSPSDAAPSAGSPSHSPVSVSPPTAPSAAEPFAGRKPEPPTPPAPGPAAPAPTAAAPPDGQDTTGVGDIAIVGLAGRYPQASDVNQFWEVLRNGRDCVTEIPEERWDYRDYFAPRRGATGRSYSKWGAFLDGVDQFDPLFFNISPRQAELMDPHERLFLETAWETIEDAGYTPETLGPATGARVGVFAGVMWNDYQLYGLESVQRGAPQVVVSTSSLIPNRVSYTFDFQGPSVAVDTACSSSLFTLHMACESIRGGECRAAVAGGVNLSLHPYKYLRLSDSNLLSTDGRCRVFGSGADGYVPGEGVGAVLVRPLSDAIAAGDQIYGVIRGSAAQHGGRTSGFAVPSPDAQHRVVLEVLEKSRVPAETITYIEAHGGATTLGDQIEIAALTKAFRRYTQEQGFCAIGSLKSNVGHLEGAAGIAALTKVLLSMRHQRIVPSLHTEELNPEIPFSTTPFHVARKTRVWERVADPRTGAPVPRRAAVSSFGFGGANAHVLVEEYVPDPVTSYGDATPGPRIIDRYVVPLSGRDDSRLRDQAQRLLGHLRAHPALRIEDITLTMSTGRRAMESRLAVAVQDTGELIRALEDFLDGREGPAPRWIGRAKHTPSMGNTDTDAPLTTESLAERWIRGHDVAWRDTLPTSARRISLPTYAFGRRHCWVPGLGGTAAKAVPPALAAPAGAATPAPVTPPSHVPVPAPTNGAMSLAPASPSAPLPRLAERTLLYRPMWTPRSGEGEPSAGTLLVFDTSAERVAELRSRTGRVVWVRPGGEYTRLSPDDYELAPDSADDHRTLFAALRADRVTPAAVLHLWQLDAPTEVGGPLGGLDAALVPVFLFCQAWTVGLDRTLPVIHAFDGGRDLPVGAAVGGFARSVRLEQPKLAVKAVDLRGPRTTAQLCALLLSETGSVGDIEVRHTDGERAVLSFARSPQSTAAGTRLARDGGVYLLSGGTGGLGLHTARHMASRARVSLVLFGRSEPGPSQETAVDEIRRAGSDAIYLRADTESQAEMERVVAEARSRFGPVTGVLHAAGVVEDALLITKPLDSLRRVLAPKLLGTRNLDLATRGERLEYFVLYSSASAVLGSVGAADYTAANRYLDAYAEWREQLRARGEVHGRTLSVNWPMWRDGGMRIHPDVEQDVLARAGLEPMSTEDGLAAFEAALAVEGPQVIVLQGDLARLEARMTSVVESVGEQPPVAALKSPPGASVPTGTAPAVGGPGAEAVVRELVELLADVLKIPQEELDVEDELADYGLDSIAATRALSVLEERYGVPMQPSLLLRHGSIRALARHLADEVLSGMPVVGAQAVAPAPPRERLVAPLSVAPVTSTSPARGTGGRIAVVAAACRFPGAPSLERFWDNLVHGRDSVGPVPEGRWSAEWLRHASPDLAAGARWGGFIDGIDQFDAAFFGIGDEEARWMDPHQRICLETAQELLDRAGYRPEEVAGSGTGVFLGVAPTDYTRRGFLAGLPTPPHLLAASLPNMASSVISHAFDLRGPSLTVDTACSSSLVALHRACQSLLAGECEAAVVGGAELLLDPFVYAGLDRAGALSKDGRSRVFAHDAAGFVPAEGVGLLFLKAEGRALEDGDTILATIVGSAVNNDGRTIGLTAPSHDAQVDVIRTALRSGGIDPATVDYLEAHGSASGFGDPIEIGAAAEAYQGAGAERPVGVGSVKTNIGALLHAGGAASLIKVVLGLHHGHLPATLHCAEQHPRIQFEKTPFRPVLDGRAWTRNGSGPRRAGVSSFGFGGTNCHVIVEEAPAGHRPTRAPLPLTTFDHRRSWLEPRDSAPPEGSLPGAMTEATGETLLSAVTQRVATTVSALLAGPAAQDLTELSAYNFMELGLSSTTLIELNAALDEEFAVAVPPTALFRHPNVPDLSSYLVREYGEELARWLAARQLDRAVDTRQLNGSAAALRRNGARSDGGSVPRSSGRREPAAVGARRTGRSDGDTEEDGADIEGISDIAIIGIGGRFPGAEGPEELWARLAAGDDLVTEVPASRWDHSRHYDPTGAVAGTTDCAHGAFLDAIDTFDADFFRVLPSEAESMDPQLRLLLEVLYATAEDAGVAPSLRGSDTGVFVGQCFQDYDNEMIARGRTVGVHDPIGAAVSMTANRPSFFFDLSGPSLTVDTACSSSLTALHLAVESLRRGECAMAFAAGTNLIASPRHYLKLSAIGALSPGGRCFSFDSRADGYVPGEAVVSVLLKPLSRALADGDPVHAVIKAVAVNHGGHASSVTAPSQARQEELLRRAWWEAGIHPATLTYLEAHGTGTKLGDPVEVDAIKAALSGRGGPEPRVALGSAKAHLGHTEGAAGLVGVVKTVLSMRHGLIPAMPSFREPNPYCRLDEGPLYVNTQPMPWNPPAGVPRRAGVSSFGFGGAYAHVVLEEPPVRQPARGVSGPLVFPFSARNPQRLRALARRHLDFLGAGCGLPAPRIAATLQIGREEAAARFAVIADSRGGLARGLEAFLAADEAEGAGRVHNMVDVAGEGSAQGLRAIELARRWTHGESVDWPTGPDGRPEPRAPLPTYPFEREHFWLREAAVPVAAARPCASAPSNGTVAADGAATGNTGEGDTAARAAELAAYVADSEYPGARILTALIDFGSLGRRLAASVLRRHTGGGMLGSRERLADRMEIVPGHERFTEFLESALRDCEPPVDGEEAEEARLRGQLSELSRVNQEIAPHIDLLTTWTPRLPDVLAGRMSAVELFFPGGDEGIPRIYGNTGIADHFNDLIAHAVAGHLRDQRARRPDEPLRILEIGAGSGATTERVLRLVDALGLPDDAVTYWFTDISPAFFPAARKRLAGWRTPVRYEAFDLEREPAEQGFELGSFDAVVATNVVHATRVLADSAGRIRRLLTEGGILALNELTRALDYLTLMFGMAPGWQASQDWRLPGSPLLDAAHWRTTLAAAGFDPVWVFSSVEVDEADADQSVLVSRATAAASRSLTANAPGAGVAVSRPEDHVAAEPAPAPDEPGPAAVAQGAAVADTATGLARYLRHEVAEFLRIPAETIDDSEPFARYGLDSLGSIQLVRTLEGTFGALPKVLLYECKTLAALAAYLLENAPEACETAAAAVATAPVVLTRAPQRSADASEPAARPSRASGPAAEEPAMPEPAVLPAPRPRHVTPTASIAASASLTSAVPRPDDPVAIVGMAGIFPGSPDYHTLWRRLRDGADLVTEIPPERFDWRPVYGDPQREPGKTNARWGAFIEGADEFDAEFFSISPLEAGLMDPQQRLLLTCAWHAIEDSGHRPGELGGTDTGVFVGATSHDYDGHLIRIGRDRESHSSLGVGHCILSNRISYQLGLHGPSETLDTACSSSLTALHRAVLALRDGECGAALVGGVHLNLGPRLFVALGQLGVLSPDGVCRPFDEKANGMVRGEGVGALYLKPLSRALADGDTVHGLVRGSGVGHSGHVPSMTVPNPAAQAELIASVYRRAGVDPRTVTYIEAHGTATNVGDPIEVRGLRKAFADLMGGADNQAVEPWCGLGSVKSNVGHLEAAAGLIGMVKTLLAMRHGALPASIHFDTANPLLELDHSPFSVIAEHRPWPRLTDEDGTELPRRAGVTSLGFGGTNAHVLLEEYIAPDRTAVPDGREPRLIVLSARSERTLRAGAGRLADHLAARRADGEPDLPLDDVAFTLRVGRDPMPWRLALLVQDTDDLLDGLGSCRDGSFESPGILAGKATGRPAADPSPSATADELARHWIAGGDLPAPPVRGAMYPPRRVPLPGYPFAPTRYWADASSGMTEEVHGTADVPQTSTGSGATPETDEEWLHLLNDLRDGVRSLEEVDDMLVLGDGSNQ